MFAGERLAGIEADAAQPELARARFGERRAVVLPTPRPCAARRDRDAPDQEVVGARLEDEHAVEPAVALRELDLIRPQKT